MNTRTLFGVMLLVSNIVGCQSAKLPAVVPNASYHSAGSYTAAPASLETPDASSTATASLVATHPPRQVVAIRPPQPARAMPDTIPVARPAAQKPASKADPVTTAVNVTGGIGVVAGIVMAAQGSTEARKEPSHMWPVMQIGYGILLMLIGIMLLFFQGKNGRQRQARLARRAAQPPKSPGATSPSTQE